MGIYSCLENPEKNPYGLEPYKIVELFIQIRTSGMVFLPVKALRPFEHVHEGTTKWFIYCRPVLRCFIFHIKQQLDHKIRDSPPSTLYVKK